MQAQHLDSDAYDVVVLGTGLAESIAAAALAKSGKRVLHLDPNEYYGGEQASLTLDELVAWVRERGGEGEGEDVASAYRQSQRKRFSRATCTPLPAALEADKRRYALSLFPALMASRGTLVHTLIASDVAKYVAFKLLDGVHIADSGGFRRVPGSKEDVFKDKTMSLPDKRKLMKALLFAGGEFEDDPVMKGHEDEPLLGFLQSAFGLSSRLAEALTYAVAYADADEPALPALQRARGYLRSIGRYGPSAFLIGQYGGAGEVAQGYCRACAVFGGTYVLGAEGAPGSIKSDAGGVEVSVPAHPTPVRATHLITAPGFVEGNTAKDGSNAAGAVVTSAHLVAVVTAQPSILVRARASEGDEDEVEDDDTGVVAFPPTPTTPLVRALVMGEGTGSCPRGQWVVYLSANADGATDPHALLAPFLERIAPQGVEFVATYLQHRQATFSDPNGAATKPATQPPTQQSPANAQSASAVASGGEGGDEGGGEVEAGVANMAVAGVGGQCSTKPPATPPAPPGIIFVHPYAGAHTLVDGLDHEAAEGARVFAVVAGSEGEFFARPEATGEEDEDE